MNKRVFAEFERENSKLGGIWGFMTGFFVFTAMFVLCCVILGLIGNGEKINNCPADKAISNIGIRRYPTIIIDPGHGGMDGGAVAESGLLEKEVNLSISKYLYDFLKLGRFDVAMTRTEDILLSSENYSGSKKRSDLLARVDFANGYSDALFISIHQNKFPVAKYSGLQVYYSGNSPQSKLFAQTVRDTNKMLLQKGNKREIKSAGSSILVLNKLEMPAILVECGFLSNPEEAALLSSEEYRRKLAFMLYTAVLNYINQNPKMNECD